VLYHDFVAYISPYKETVRSGAFRALIAKALQAGRRFAITYNCLELRV
jgi:hypothetical protein